MLDLMPFMFWKIYAHTFNNDRQGCVHFIGSKFEMLFQKLMKNR